MSVFTTLATDTFNRANENPLSDGGNWTTPVGEFFSGATQPLQVVSDQCEATHSIVNAALYSGISWPNDQWAQFKLSGGSAEAAIILRAVDNGTSVTYIIAVTPAAPAINIAETGTPAGGSVSTPLGSGSVIRLAVLGSTAFIYVNGVLLGASTGFTLASGSAGILLEVGGNLSQSNVVNFVGGSLRGSSVSGNLANLGIAGATISWTSVPVSNMSDGSYSVSGNTTADGSGNYSTGEILPDGTYTFTPSLPGYSFSSASQTVIISNNDASGINFTAAPNRFTFLERSTPQPGGTQYDVIDSGDSKKVGTLFWDNVVARAWSFNLQDNTPHITAGSADASEISTFASALPTPPGIVTTYDPTAGASTRFQFIPFVRRSGEPALAYIVIDGPTQTEGSEVGRIIWDGSADAWCFLQTNVSANLAWAPDVNCIVNFAANLQKISPNQISL